MATIKGSDQISIVDVTDAYSVILSNESHTFVGSTDAALAGTATTNVYAFQGGTPVAIQIGTITGKTGITAQITNNGTASPLITFTVTNALKDGGTIDIPVTIVDTDITITKKFTYGIAFKGATGAQGDKGDAGNGVKSTEVTYQASSSGTTIPTGTWGSSIPTVNAGQYLWTKTEITYTDGTSSKSYSVGMMGATGAQGDKGNTGDAGVGVKSTSVTYQKSTSGTTAPTGTWAATIPTVGASEYLWTKTEITYTDNTTSISYSVGMMGATGAKGDKGDAGADAITISITTDNGNIFKNSEGTTTLTAHVYRAGTELTAAQISALGTLKWYKDGSTTAIGTGATIAVAASSVTNKAVYTVQLEG